MKAIYKKVGNQYYQVNRNLRTPINITRMTHTHTALSCGCNSDSIGVHVWVETMDRVHPPTNRKLANTMLKDLKENMVTQIDTLENAYKVYMEYSILNKDGKELEHSVAVTSVSPTEGIRPLGVNCNNECIYRQVDLLKANFDMTLKSTIPFGIMNKRPGYTVLNIHDIVVLQEASQSDRTPSMYGECYRYGSPTIQATLENMINIYSTRNEGIILEGIELNQLPRKITVDVDISLADSIVVYDNEVITHILEENYTHLDPDDDDTDYTGGCGCGCRPLPDPEPDDEPEEPPIELPPDDTCDCPCCKPEKPIPPKDEPEYPEDTIFWRCSKHTTGGLEVVADITPDHLFKGHIIKKKYVVKSIPDIQIGEFVMVVEQDDTDE